MACWAAANTPRPTAVELLKDSRGRESGSSGVGRGLNDAAGRHLKLDKCIKNLKSKLTIVDDNVRRPKLCIDSLEHSLNALGAAGINFDGVEASVSSILRFQEPRATRYPFCLRIVPTAAPTWGPAPMINVTRDMLFVCIWWDWNL